MTDESLPSLTDLRAFERDLLFAVRALEEDTPPKGLTVKHYLEDEYGDFGHSRLYQNLDALTEKGLIAKSDRDGRTNEYATTDVARELLEAYAAKRAEQAGIELADEAVELRDRTELPEDQRELGETTLSEGGA